MRNPIPRVALILALMTSMAACGEDDEGVDSDEEARRAYLGLDKSIEKSLQLGLAGFSAATSANIPAQSAMGDVTGTIMITGQVDQGASTNKGLRLDVLLTNYSDGPAVTVEGDDIEITYATAPLMLPRLTLSLRDIPTGTFTGTLVGTYQATGDIVGTTTLNLSFSGKLESNGTGGTRRVIGMTTVTGTAVSGEGTFDVNVTI